MKKTQHYALKHPKNTKLDPEIVKAINLKLSDKKISCAASHKLAHQFSVSPAEIGKSLDLLGLRICKCQLGLFGYDEKILKPADHVSPELSQIIKSNLTNNRLPCSNAWEIANNFEMTKIEVAQACEGLEVKIKPCQLGAF